MHYLAITLNKSNFSLGKTLFSHINPHQLQLFCFLSNVNNKEQSLNLIKSKQSIEEKCISS